MSSRFFIKFHSIFTKIKLANIKIQIFCFFTIRYFSTTKKMIFFKYYFYSILFYFLEILFLNVFLMFFDQILLVNFLLRFIFSFLAGIFYKFFLFSHISKFEIKYMIALVTVPIFSTILLSILKDYLSLLIAKVIADIIISLLGYFFISRNFKYEKWYLFNWIFRTDRNRP